MKSANQHAAHCACAVAHDLKIAISATNGPIWLKFSIEGLFDALVRLKSLPMFFCQGSSVQEKVFCSIDSLLRFCNAPKGVAPT